MEEKRELKRVLIYLYEKFNGSQDLIIQELAERQITADKKTVNQYLKEHNIKATDYYAFFESKFPSEFRDVSRPIMIINKKLDKSVKRFLGYKLQMTNNSKIGQTYNGKPLKDFLYDTDISQELTIRELNSILVENDLAPIKVN